MLSAIDLPVMQKISRQCHDLIRILFCLQLRQCQSHAVVLCGFRPPLILSDVHIKAVSHAGECSIAGMPEQNKIVESNYTNMR